MLIPILRLLPYLPCSTVPFILTCHTSACHAALLRRLMSRLEIGVTAEAYNSVLPCNSTHAQLNAKPQNPSQIIHNSSFGPLRNTF